MIDTQIQSENWNEGARKEKSKTFIYCRVCEKEKGLDSGLDLDLILGRHKKHFFCVCEISKKGLG